MDLIARCVGAFEGCLPRPSFVTIGIRAVLERSFSARFDRDSVPLILERPTMRPLHILAAAK